MKNKKGMGATAVILIAILVLGVGGFAYWAVGQSGVGANASTNPLACSDSTGIVTVNAFNKASQGTNLSPTLKYGVNGGGVTSTLTSGTTALAIGTKVVIHGALNDYVDTSVTGTVACGGLTIDMPMDAVSSANPVITIRNQNLDAVTDSSVGGATNVTSLSAGETVSLGVEFKGTNLESSGTFIWVIETPASTSANVSDILLNGAEKVSTPKVHTTVNAGSKVQAFRVPAVVGAEIKKYDLSIVLASGKDLAGGILTDLYGEQAFIDDDGTVKIGVETSTTNTAKYENNYDFDFYINA